MGLSNTESGTIVVLRPDPRTTWPKIRLRPSVVHGVTAGAVIVVALAFVHPVAGHAPVLRATIETVITSLALTATVIWQAQLARTREWRELMLFGALLTLTLVELSAYWLPAALNMRPGSYAAAAERWGILFAAGAFFAASHARSDGLRPPGLRPLAITVALSLLALVLAGALGVALRPRPLTTSAHPFSDPGQTMAHPLGVLVTLGASGLFAFAAAAFVRAAVPGRDSVQHLLGYACILLAGAQLYSVPLAWLGPSWISPREGLRLLAGALFVAGALRREVKVRAGIARAAAIAERRRVAQDLHDGLAQDLALIASHRPLITAELGGEHPVTVAALRALALSRGTIKELSDPAGVTMQEVLEAVAHELSERFEIAIAVHGDLDTEPAPDVREHLARIAREAIANAARHGGANAVAVSLKRTVDGIALRVTDDGCGLGDVPFAPAREGFGLHCMRERTASLGGHLTIRQAGRKGTELEVVLP